MKNLLKNKYLIIILVISFLVRIVGMTSESVWLDEAIQIYNVKLINIEFYDYYPSLYKFVLRFIVYLGINEFWTRLPSVIFGTIAVYIVYLLGKELFNEETGLISSLIFGLSRYNIYFSQEARPYSLLVLTSALSMYFFVRFSKKTKDKKTLLSYFITTLLMIYTHYYALFTVLVQNIFFFKKKVLKKWIITQFLLFLSFIPQLIIFYNSFLTLKTENLGQGFIEFTYINRNFSGGILLNILFFTLLIYSLFILSRDKKKNELSLMWLWLLIPILIPFFITIFRPVFISRHIIFCTIPYYMIISYMITKLKKIKKHLVLVIIIFSLIFIGIQIFKYDNIPWQDLTTYVKSKNAKAILIEPGYNILPFMYYYDRNCFQEVDIYSCSAENKVYTLWGNEEEKSYTDYADKIVYLKRNLNNNIEETDYLLYLNSNFYLVEKTEFKTRYKLIVSVYVFERE